MAKYKALVGIQPSPLMQSRRTSACFQTKEFRGSTLLGTLFPRVVKEMKKKGIKNVLVVGGGVIPDVDKKALKKAGISEVFGPGTSLSNVIDYVNAGVLKLGKK